MKNVAIDLGNTRSKTALFEDNRLVEGLETTDTDLLLRTIESYNADNFIVSSVRKDTDLLAGKLPKKPLIFNNNVPIPIENCYKSPQMLGTDRLAAAIGAKALFPDKPCLVIDLGTCITYDFVTADNKFMGGMIAPGVRMRLKAMHEFTQKLPLVEWKPEQEVPITASTTEEAILSGAVNGVKGEIHSLREYYQILHPDLQTILCGGDSIYFENIKKAGTFAVPKLVLYGLNQILMYNLPLASN